jgi:FkbM family methyltransferase
VDVGSHEGEFLTLFLKIAPKGTHFGFEPLPYLYNSLLARFNNNPNCTIYNYALSDKEGLSSFNHVISNPAYSGIKKRKYDRPHEKDEIISVATKKMDTVIPEGVRIDFIKIDVEGGEFHVLKGAERIISSYHPLIIFEFGIGGSDIYGVTPAIMFKFLEEKGYSVSLLNNFLSKRKAMTLKEFEKQFTEKTNYYFIARPAKK